MGLVIGTSSVLIASTILYKFVEDDLNSSAQLVSGQIHQKILTIGQEVSELAKSEEVEKYYHSNRKIVLVSLFKNHSRSFDQISYINFKGVTKTSYTKNKVVENETPIDSSHSFLLTLKSPDTLFIDGPVYDEVIQKSVLRFYYRHIDYFDNEFGVIRASISLEAFAHHMNEMFQKERRYSILLTNIHHRIIYGPKTGDFGKSGQGIIANILKTKKTTETGYLGKHMVYGVSSLVAVNPLPDLKWNSYIIKSTKTIKRLLYDLFALVFLVTLTALAFGEFFSRRLGIKIIEPIERLTQVTSDILENGNLEKRVIWNSNDEMGQLADLFNSMLEKIDIKQHQFQKERTLELEQEIGKRKKDQKRLRKAIVEAEAATRAKSDFLANMSHEIRTPMNGIIGMVELALDTRLNRNQTNLITTINAEAESLLAIINSILDFSKIEAGKLQLELIPFNLRHLFEDLNTTFAITAQKKGLELVSFLPPDIPEHLIGDPGRLRQVLVNIVGNALKFTNKGEIYIKVDEVQDHDKEIRLKFSIKDTGIGISEEQQKTIFDSFSQADGSTTRKYGGTGLGTTISKQLVEMMGGTMGFESKPFSGSTFWFTMVFEKNQDTGIFKPDQNLPRGLKVLVLDDNKNNWFVLSHYLTALGCIPLQAGNNQTALDLLSGQAQAGNPIQLILSDHKTLHMAGFQLAAKIKALPVEYRAPLILLTSICSMEDYDTCKKSGIRGCLSKPVRMDELKTTILSTMNHGLLDKKDCRKISKLHIDPLPRPKKIKILLAEDYPTNQQIAIRHLIHSGFQVRLAENGQQAVELFNQDKFDLVLMDIQMPVMDGLKATREIRKKEQKTANINDSFQRTPIIAMTAHAIKGYREKCFKVDMDDYITKPLKRKELIRMVEKWIYGNNDNQTLFNKEESPQTAPLDINKALNEFDNDKVFFEEVLNEFLDNLEQQIQSIDQAILDTDHETVRAHAHAIKGGAANLTAISLSMAAGALEKSGKAENFKSIAGQMALLKKEFDRVKIFAQYKSAKEFK